MPGGIARKLPERAPLQKSRDPAVIYCDLVPNPVLVTEGALLVAEGIVAQRRRPVPASWIMTSHAVLRPKTNVGGGRSPEHSMDYQFQPIC